MSDDEERLLVAMKQAPAERGPRQAYARWLEQRGDARCKYFHAEERLRLTPLGDPSRQTLGRTWRELRAGMEPRWLAQVELCPPVPAWAPSELRHAAQIGLNDWEGWACQSQYEWVLIAALAPIEQVVRIVGEARTGSSADSLQASGQWRSMAPVQQAQIYEKIAPGIPFVQLRSHAWTVAMYATFQFSLVRSDAAQSDARELSDRLGTLAVEFSAESVSSATGYQLFECGELIEFAEDSPEETTFASKRRPPPWLVAPRHFPDEVFRALGLYLPGFYVGADGVRIGVPDPSLVERADILNYDWSHREFSLEELRRCDEGFAEIHLMRREDAELS
ncbi:MAG TPA: hypothetical protein VHC19_18530 [Pirellulales bacterium]|nr:hypothetical protein [Pirellulales bacterium]